MHEVYVGDVAIGKDHLVNGLFEDQLFEFLLRVDGNAIGVKGAAQRCRITTVLDARDLSRGERHDFVFGIVTEAKIEGVKISAGRTHDEDSFPVGAIG